MFPLCCKEYCTLRRVRKVVTYFSPGRFAPSMWRHSAPSSALAGGERHHLRVQLRHHRCHQSALAFCACFGSFWRIPPRMDRHIETFSRCHSPHISPYTRPRIGLLSIVIYSGVAVNRRKRTMISNKMYATMCVSYDVAPGLVPRIPIDGTAPLPSLLCGRVPTLFLSFPRRTCGGAGVVAAPAVYSSSGRGGRRAQ